MSAQSEGIKKIQAQHDEFVKDHSQAGTQGLEELIIGDFPEYFFKTPIPDPISEKTIATLKQWSTDSKDQLADAKEKLGKSALGGIYLP